MSGVLNCSAASASRLCSEKFRIKILHHGRTGSGRNHHRIVASQSLEDPDRDLAAFIPESRVEGRLAATDNAFLEINGVSELFENTHHADTHRGEQLIHETGYEQVDLQRKNASIKPPSTVITWPVVLLRRLVSSK